MTEPTRNEGIIIHGGTQNGPMAAGDQARAWQYQVGSNDVGQLLAQLRDLVGQHRRDLPEPDRIVADLDVIDREMGETESRRDRKRLMAALDRVTHRAATVASLAVAVDQLRQLVM